MLTDEAKKNILKLVLSKIADIASKKYQERVWVRGEGPEWDDFDETVCLFFDHSELIIASCKDFGITEEQYKIFKQFCDEFQEFADNHDWPQEFIDTPEWAEIMEKAKGVLKAFHYPERVE